MTHTTPREVGQAPSPTPTWAACTYPAPAIATTPEPAGRNGFRRGRLWCDYSVEETGQHYHCEWGGFIGYGGSCSWCWADNTIAPPPPPELIGW